MKHVMLLGYNPPILDVEKGPRDIVATSAAKLGSLIEITQVRLHCEEVQHVFVRGQLWAVDEDARGMKTDPLRQDIKACERI